MMTIEIDGSRTSDEGWRRADALPLPVLRELTAQEVAWRGPDDLEARQVARKLYAMRVTLPELVSKCRKLGDLAMDWLAREGVQGEVSVVRLRCLRGLFDVYVAQDGELHRLEIREEVLDDLLQAGSREAADSLERLFAANFGRFAMSRAS